ncbi:VWDE-like protein [Mya arenaria]|uniref:VWDE-like protein n=1 Tax=Mya arenaria TaxID=6604 RepID=A0ABY7G1W5_MYAAR|nr:VWDE-like protein [Mya arenaria]
MNGTHPAALGAIVTNNVCAIDMTGLDCCSLQSTIRVKNCSTFFAYELKPAPGCHMSYCADKFPQMLTSPHLSNPILTPGSFKFQCDINFDHARRDVGFDVQFLFDDKPDRNVPPVHITDGVTRHADLDQNLLKGHMGQNVSATRDGKADKDKDIFLHFNPIYTADAPRFFNNYQIPLMQILAKDINTSTCWCTGDPHCITLDTTLTKKGSYLDYYLIGEFIMYNSTTRDFQVSFPSGAQVKVTNYRSVALNVHITAPEVDFSGTEGLCGFFDGNRDNDLTYPTGKIATFPTNRSQNNNFVESWRIPVGDSFFDKTPAIDPKLNRHMNYCKCDQKPQLLANFPSVNGKSRAEAEKACNSAIDNNPTLQQCIAKAGLDFSNEKDICIEDFKYFDNGELVRSALHTAIYKCTDHVLRNVSLHDTSGNPPAYATSELCPDYDCNDNGVCVNGTCICNHGFVGDSTSYIGKSVLCDVTDRECVTSYVHGDNIYDNSRLSCRVRVMQFDGHGFVYKGHTFTTGVVYRSMYDVGCRLPTKASIGDNQPVTTAESHTVTTPPTAPQGGTYLKRFDIWTFSQSGCQCAHNHALYTCACCDVGGCQCQAPHSNQCVKCEDTHICGHRIGACPCGRTQRNQCAACDFMYQCGNKPWIFGPPMA